MPPDGPPRGALGLAIAEYSERADAVALALVRGEVHAAVIEDVDEMVTGRINEAVSDARDDWQWAQSQAARGRELSDLSATEGCVPWG